MRIRLKGREKRRNMRTQVQVIDNKRLAGGGRSHVRTLLRRNSLLTGKITGNFAILPA